MIQWRRFQFFDKELVKEEGTNTPHQALQKLVITCSANGRGNLIFGDAEGFINIVDRDFKVFSFRAYEYACTHIHHLKERSILISIGHDDETISSTIKIWNLDKMDKNENPLCLKSFKIEKVSTAPVSCIAVLDDLSQFAIGLCNGIVVIVRGDIVRDKTPKMKVLKSEGVDPITGLAFRVDKSILLFVITTNQIISYWTSNKDQETILDDQGAELGCVVMSDEQDLIVGRTEAVYFYGPEGRGPCFGFEGQKLKLAWFRNYLIILGLDSSTPSSGSLSSSSSSLPAGLSNTKYNSFNIYDLKNRFYAFSEPRFENVTQIVSEWGSIFVLCSDGKIFQLEEKDTQTKLEILFVKNLYSVAINLAHSQHYDHHSIVDIFRRYGDHLYGKGDYDGAIAQYQKTIGNLEPSYVIRKFLDAQRIYNLTSYLQALHERGLANADHTTLLLNCYTKLKDVSKLDHFIKAEGTSFDVETAIKVCRQAQYYEHALYLAKKHSEHDHYLKILLEDLQNYQKALDYISTLPFLEAEKNLKKYGKSLVSALPELSTKLLMKLCTASSTPTPSPISSKTENVTSSNTATRTNLSPEDQQREDLFGPSPSRTPTASKHSDLSSFIDTEVMVNNSGLKAVPEEFIHIFVNQPEWLAKFLEFIVQQGEASTLVYNTLLELYMREDQPLNGTSNNTATSPSSSFDRQKRLEKAMALLTDPTAKFDEDHALVLAQVHQFHAGVLHLYEKLKLYNEIIQYHMEHGDHLQLIRACKKYGDKAPNLWVQVLSYFACKETDCQQEIMEVLANIDKYNLIPPLLVIQILAQKKTTPLSVIKEYITRCLSQENQQIQEDYRLIRTFTEETEKFRQEVHELRTSAKIFQQSKCFSCASPLDLPAVHFLCNHSFHQRCLAENERECPVCTPNNRKVLEVKRLLMESANLHDQFFKQLEGSPDGFSTVSEYFGRGIFNVPQTPSNNVPASNTTTRSRANGL